MSAPPRRSPAAAPAGDGSVAGPTELRGTPASDAPSPACARSPAAGLAACSPVPPERQVLLLLPRLLHPRAAFAPGCSAPPAPRASPGGSAPGAPAARSSFLTCRRRGKPGARVGGGKRCPAAIPAAVPPFPLTPSLPRRREIRSPCGEL